MGRDEKTWPEPDKFLPESFLGVSTDLRGGGGFELIPFGGSALGCRPVRMGVAYRKRS